MSIRYKIFCSILLITLTLTAISLVYINVLLVVTTLISYVTLITAIYDMHQKKHSLLRNFPLIARLRWLFESERSKIQQYFIEDDKNGTPYNREKRSDIYQKSKGETNTTPFGTQLDVYKQGYEFLRHSMYPKDVSEVSEPRVIIGSKFCKKHYSASIFNISAMSYGALSSAAIKALNGGAKLGNFYHNTGEGGISQFHNENGGDLCFQIGTGYFGAGKTIDGKRYFNVDAFTKSIKQNNVKMVEIKLSQGAKPGHGGILPASKNSVEIAKIRGIEPNTDVLSPPYHTAFNSPSSMIDFIDTLRKLSGGLPIGIKMCVGNEDEVVELIKTFKQVGIYPDFITIDGGEGGTGAAPIVFSNNVGMPLIEALIFVNKTLEDFGLRNDIKIIASGKASSSFDVIKLISLGADVVNAARAFMFSLGCIQARECHKNTCPVGVATQDKKLINGLDPEDKKNRVYNYHRKVIHEIREVIGAMGLTSTRDLTYDKITYRNEQGVLTKYK